MPGYSEYKCSVCQRETLRDLLTAKKISFTTMGAGAKTLRTRTVAWLCDECILVDEDYTREAYSGAPGMQSPALERVRAAEGKAK
jgi:hypothetical protein